MSTNVLVFGIVFVFAILFFCWSCYMRFRLIGLGTHEDRFSNVGKRLWNVISLAIIQRCTLSKTYKFGINHFILFWCFLLLLIANTEFLLHGLFPDYIALSKLPAGLHHALALIFDIVSIGALLSVILAVSRRLFFPPKYIEARTPDAFTILSLIAALMIAFFGLHGSEIAMGKDAEAAAFMPISGMVGSWMAGIPKSTLEILSQFFWWLHAIVLLSFLNYLPYSKHMHILTSLPNCYFKSLEKVTTQPREEFKSENIFGVSQVDQFRWKDLFDSYSCTECGRCSDNCPATNTDKPLNPRLVIHDIKVNLLENGPSLLKNQPTKTSLIGKGNGSIEPEAIWACTTCGACMEVCPVRIEHVPKLVSMRRNLVEMKAEFPPELLNLFENMEQRSNPWGSAPGDRVKWAAEADVKTFESGKTEYLFYVGCFGAFDSRSKQSTLALAKILNAAGISWGILGKDELCCGDSLRRLGNEYVFDRMAKENVKLFADRGIKKIITQCPHCYNTLKNDYKQYGAELDVIHHSELISDLIRQGKLTLAGDKDLGKVIFHDSCYLGRYNGIYEQPRAVIAAATGKAPAEMNRNHDRSFCCGAGGGRMWMEESLGKRINLDRVQEALKEKPKTVCVSCPYCMAMFEDGLKDEKASDTVQVLELSEIVAQSLK